LTLWWAGAAVVALSLAAYANSITNAFVLDDIPIIVQNPLVRSLANLTRIFTSDYWAGSGMDGVLRDPGLYRPLTIFTYALNYAVSGLSPVAFHATNVALHAATAVMVLLLAVELLGPTVAAFAAGAIFAVHPIHAEAVTGVVGRAELLTAFFALLSLRVGRGTSISAAAGSGVFYLLALFSKESAAMLPALFLLYDWTRQGSSDRSARTPLKALAPRYVALAIALIVYAAFRFNAVKLPAHSWDGWLGVPGYARVLTAIRVLAEYLLLFIWPRTLLADYAAGDVPVARSPDVAVLLSVALWIALIVAFTTKLRRHRVLLFSFAWFFLAILPASNLLFAAGLGKAERILYFPSVGLCLATGWVIQWLYDRAATRQTPLAIAFSAVLLALAMRTWRRNEDWRNDLVLARASLAISPASALMNSVAGTELLKLDSTREATPFLERAVREAPAKPFYHVRLGSAYYSAQQSERAAAEFQRALQLSPRDPDALSDLGAIYIDRHDLNQALTLLNAALSASPRHAGAHMNRGLVYLAAGRIDDAIQDFRAAIDIDPSRADGHNNLGVAYGRSGRLREAAAEFREALRLRPDYASARTNLSAVLSSSPR